MSNTNVIDATTALTTIRAHGGKFFRVSFARKTAGKNGEKPGDIRRMLCRRSVRKYTKGVLLPGVRKEEDAKNAVLTVWDVEKFHQARKAGKGLKAAGRSSYRRINLSEVVELTGV